MKVIETGSTTGSPPAMVDKIATAPVKAAQTGELSQPIDPVMITSVEIIED